LPYRLDTDGNPQSLVILLVTSRDTGRWVLPKGNVKRQEDPRTAALREAAEEAGVWGVVAAEPIGDYRYAKRHDDGTSTSMTVSVWPMRVDAVGDDWPEGDVRTRAWFSPADAAMAVDEKSLKKLLLRFRA
jgi:8-oxo-dGTP pyrophosphatase MutT (NUDIX family)